MSGDGGRPLQSLTITCRQYGAKIVSQYREKAVAKFGEDYFSKESVETLLW